MTDTTPSTPIPQPTRGGSYVRHPETHELVREGGTQTREEAAEAAEAAAAAQPKQTTE